MKRPDQNTPGGVALRTELVESTPGNGHGIATEPRVPESLPQRHPHELTAAKLRLLWENRRFLARFTAAGLVLSTTMAFLMPNQYQSVARLMPPENQSTAGLAMVASALGGAASGLGSIASEFLGMKSTSDLLVGVLASRSVGDKIIQQFDLRKVYGSPRTKIEDIRKRLEYATDLSVDRKSQIITIKVTDRSPQRAAAIAEAYVNELNRTVALVSTSSARRERIFLEERLKTVSVDLEAAEKEFSQFASQNTTIDIKEQGKAMVEAAAILQGQLIAARSELEGLRQIYADSNVRVRALHARIGELENQLRKVGGQNDTAALETNGPGDSLYPSIKQLPLLGVRYADLYRKARVQEAVFEKLTQQYELSRVQEAKEIPSVRVLDPPNLPEKKTFPPHMLLMLLGTALAFSFGTAWVFGRTRWEKADPFDPRIVLAREVFGVLKASLPWGSRNGHRTHATENSSTDVGE